MGEEVKRDIRGEIEEKFDGFKKTAGVGAALCGGIGATLGAMIGGPVGAAIGGAVGGGFGGYFGTKRTKNKS